MQDPQRKKCLSIVVPCYNEEDTLEECIERLLGIQDNELSIEVIIVDDCSTDASYAIAQRLSGQHGEVTVLRHAVNTGKGAALRTGFKKAVGDFVAIQDADLEYDPKDIKRLLVPLINGDADVVLGSRFAASGTRRVLYFWHSLGNRLLTFISNMFTDLNLTDMETCYKVFRREIIQAIELKEDRFGVEPEIIAKIARINLRIYEMGVSYYGRTYEEGKKIGFRDGVRALYCIFKFNAHSLPMPLQFLAYSSIGALAAALNLATFMILLLMKCTVFFSALTAFVLAAALNYLLCISLIFRHKAYWNSTMEIMVYGGVVCLAGSIDISSTMFLMDSGYSAFWAKITAIAIGVLLNFFARRWLVFPILGKKKTKTGEGAIKKLRESRISQ